MTYAKFIASLGLVMAQGCSSGESSLSNPVVAVPPAETTPNTGQSGHRERIVISPRTRVLATYPCSGCHATLVLGEPQVPPRGPHHGLRFAHMENVGDCRQCHSYDKLDMLRLITGERVSFDQSERLCGQCHGRERRDWAMGIHGKQVGSWRGIKHRYSCPQCHDPHRPAQPAVTAYPPPPFPRLGIRKETH